MENNSLIQILRTLEKHRQRATYGAVASILSANPRSFMAGYPRDPLHSWVVNKSDGEPTGYQEVEKHPELKTRSTVIAEGEELAAWLAAPK